MPVEPCTTTVNGETRPGRRWGDSPGATCYPCTPDNDCNEAEGKATKQGQAIEIAKHRAILELWTRAHS